LCFRDFLFILYVIRVLNNEKVRYIMEINYKNAKELLDALLALQESRNLEELEVICRFPSDDEDRYPSEVFVSNTTLILC